MAAELTCVVCLDTIDDANRHFLPCTHCFHDKCIKRWIKKKRVCPTCKISIDRDEKTPLKGKPIVEVVEYYIPDPYAMSAIQHMLDVLSCEDNHRSPWYPMRENKH